MNPLRRAQIAFWRWQRARLVAKHRVRAAGFDATTKALGITNGRRQWMPAYLIDPLLEENRRLAELRVRIDMLETKLKNTLWDTL